ncbi:hypothetical protein [Nocardia sp. XZ_19_369]|uniref:hypothetical protein n=1 Tax=Nocardia sp. XZ_19_369 TaxID=2769487 RepID=UPI001E2AD6B5|nr:hypothetical protein [Nocardia sp. XZ_19_369]
MRAKTILLLDISGTAAILSGLWLLGPAFAIIGAGAIFLIAAALIDRRVDRS